MRNWWSAVCDKDHSQYGIQSCEEFDKDLALGLLDLLKNAVEKISDYDSNQNYITDV